MMRLIAALFCLSAFTTAAHAQLRNAEAQIEPVDAPAAQCLVDEGADFEMELNGQRYGCYALPTGGSAYYVILDENGNQYGDTGLGACPGSLPAGHQCCIAGGACHTY